MINHDIRYEDVGCIEDTLAEWSVKWPSKRFVIKGHSTTDNVADVFGLVVFLEEFSIVLVMVVDTLNALDTLLVDTLWHMLVSLDTLDTLNTWVDSMDTLLMVDSVDALETLFAHGLVDSVSLTIHNTGHWSCLVYMVKLSSVVLSALNSCLSHVMGHVGEGIARWVLLVQVVTIVVLQFLDLLTSESALEVKWNNIHGMLNASWHMLTNHLRILVDTDHLVVASLEGLVLVADNWTVRNAHGLNRVDDHQDLKRKTTVGALGDG